MKKEIRKNILQQREALEQKEVVLKSKQIFEKLINTEAYKKSRNILTYISFRNEVKTDLIITDGIKKNKKINIPLCNTDIKEIIVCEMGGWDDLEPCAFGVPEPKKDAIKIANRKYIDLVIVPGAVFDIKGNRIGYGAGYYDKFFSSLKEDVYKIGICYSFQVVDFVPASPHDIPMDYIITENEIIKCNC